MTELGGGHLFPDFGKNPSVQYTAARDDDAQQGGGSDIHTFFGSDKKNDSWRHVE